MGFVLLGLAALTPNGMSGAMLQMFNHGTITAGLFLLVGVLYDRTHTRTMSDFGGIGAQMPVYAGILTFFTMASLGLPGLSGFISEFLTLLGAYTYNKILTGLSCVGIILAAAYLLYMIQRVLLGPLNEKWKALSEISVREMVTLVPLMIPIIVIGLYPKLILNAMGPALAALISRVGGAGL